MAKNFRQTYSINGTHDTKAIDSTRKGLQDLEGQAAKTNKILSFAGVAVAAKAVFDTVSKAVKAVAQAVDGSIQAFATQQQALAGLSQAIGNNVNLTSASMTRLVNLTGQLQKNSIYGDEELQKQAAYLAGMGLTEEQISATLTASADLASAGIMPLDAAVKNMAKQFGGMAGELGEKIPALRTLTAEQLKAGEGIALVQAQFAGAALSMTDTLAGRQQQFNNLLGDIKEKTGSVLGVFKQLALEKSLPILDSINEWLADFAPKLINFFLNLPQIFSIVFKSAKSMMETVFTLDFWKNYFDAVGKLILDVFRLTFSTVWDIIKAIGTTLWEPIKYGFESFIFAIKYDWAEFVNVLTSALEGVINFFIGGLNRLLDVANKISNFLGKGDVVGSIRTVAITRMEMPTNAPTFNGGGAILDAWKNVGTNLVNNTKSLVDTYKSSITQITEPLADDFTAMVAEVSAILGQDLPENIQRMLAPAISAAENAAAAAGALAAPGYSIADRSGAVAYRPGADGTEPARDPLGEATDAIASKVSGLGGSVGQIANILTNLAESGDYIGAIIQVVLIAVDGLLSTVGGPLMAVADVLIKMISDVGASLGVYLLPLFNALLPILDIFAVMLQSAIVPVLNLMALPMSIIAGLLQVLAPILKYVAAAFEVVMAPVRYLGDLFQWAAKQIGVAIHNLVEYIDHPINANNRQLQSYSAFSSDAFTGLAGRVDAILGMPTAGSLVTAPAGTGGSLGGSSASYSGSRDITVNVNITQSAIADLRDIAMLIRNEIKSAEALGY